MLEEAITVATTTIPTGHVGRGHYGAWRAVAALPVMIGSTLLLLVLLGWMGEWDGLALLVWLGCGLLTLTRRGERVAVHLACGFRRLSPDDSAALSGVWSEVLARCEVSPDDVDLYVQRGKSVNAYTVGGRSVAVTSRVVRDYRAGRLDDRLLTPILCHELGHHATYGGRFTPITLWLALPWRLFCGAVLRVATKFAGWQPRAPLFMVVVAAFVVAIVQASQHHAWSTVIVLSSLVVFSIACPLADAAISRASEGAADQYAAQAGFGHDLARALASIAPDSRDRWRLADAALARHPRTQDESEISTAVLSGKCRRPIRPRPSPHNDDAADSDGTCLEPSGSPRRSTTVRRSRHGCSYRRSSSVTACSTSCRRCRPTATGRRPTSREPS